MTDKRMFDSTKEMFDQIEWCGYECEAGVMTMNVAYIALKEHVELMEKTLAWYGNRDNYSANTAHNGFDVITDNGQLARTTTGTE
jgi:hypothetical protein